MMKRIRLWLRELSLSQQLLTILFLVISALTVFIFAFLTPQINEITTKEMYRVLHSTHSSLSWYLNQHEKEETIPLGSGDDGGVIHIIYERDTDTFLVPAFAAEITDAVEQDIRGNLTGIEEGMHDFAYLPEARSAPALLYTVSAIRDNRVLISLMTSASESQFRSLLINNVVNLNILVAIVLFVILTVWVTTIIYPLNQIKNYIAKIKNDEPAELTINRYDEIGDVAYALVDMEKELQKQSKEKQEMIQNISHDLKTPIATIRSYSESIKDGIYPYGTLEKSIDVIIEHADRLEKKVRSLIALNKMDYLLDECEEGEHLNMNEVIDKVLLSLKVIRPEITFERDMDKNVMFHGDEDPWRIVVENLVDNALRYAESTIRIELHPGELNVINDGAPIEEDRLPKLFKPYERGTGGQFGLGLSIVYKIVTTYGYHITAENLAKGVAFRIWKEMDKKEMRAIQKEKKKTERLRAREKKLEKAENKDRNEA